MNIGDMVIFPVFGNEQTGIILQLFDDSNGVPSAFVQGQPVRGISNTGQYSRHISDIRESKVLQAINTLTEI